MTASSSRMDFCLLASCEVQNGGSRKTIFDSDGNQNVTLMLSVWLRAEFQIDRVRKTSDPLISRSKLKQHVYFSLHNIHLRKEEKEE